MLVLRMFAPYLYGPSHFASHRCFIMFRCGYLDCYLHQNWAGDSNTHRNTRHSSRRPHRRRPWCRRPFRRIPFTLTTPNTRLNPAPKSPPDQMALSSGDYIDVLARQLYLPVTGHGLAADTLRLCFKLGCCRPVPKLRL